MHSECLFCLRQTAREMDTQMNRRLLSEVMMHFEEENIPVMSSFTG
jgi:hypothetical protein